MAKKTGRPDKYRVLIRCKSGKSKKTYQPGEIVSNADFPQAVIDNWVSTVPPVLAPENAPGNELEAIETDNPDENAPGEEESEVTDGKQ